MGASGNSGNEVNIKHYLNKGRKLITLYNNNSYNAEGQKREEGTPNILKWQADDVRVDDSVLLNHDGPIGWVIGDDDVVIDIDPRNGGTESWERLCEDLDLDPDIDYELTPSVVTARDGFHIYLKLSDKWQGYSFRKNLKQYKGVDFLTKGSYCVIAGSVSESKGGEYRWFGGGTEGDAGLTCPDEIVNLYSKGKSKSKSSGEGVGSSGSSGSDSFSEDLDEDMSDLESACAVSVSGWSQEKVEELLSKLDNNMPNDDWVKVGLAIYRWSGGSDKGLQLWENWSAGGHTYKEGETQKRWNSFDFNPGGDENKITLGSLVYMAREAEFEEESVRLNKVIEEVQGADEMHVRRVMMPKLKKAENQFDSIDREKVVKCIQDRLKDLTGVKMPVAQIRKEIKCDDYSDRRSKAGGFVGGGGFGASGENGAGSPEIVDGHFLQSDVVPKWCQDWIYVNNLNAFMDLKTLDIHKSESFNVENGIYVPESDGGTKMSATKYVSDNGYVNKVSNVAYLPTCEGQIVVKDNRLLLNTFDRRTIPQATPYSVLDFSEQEIKVIDKLKRHTSYVCGGEDDAQILLQWLAHQVQHPGKIVGWAPLIWGVQGLGKSFFANLLRSVLGYSNVGTVGPEQVTSNHNEWAAGVCVNILEELMIEGHNRYEVTNKTKPLITNEMIPINPKGVSSYMTYNTCNYMAFTNRKNAIPLDADDRRWWVKFMPYDSREEFYQVTGEDPHTYFPELFNDLRDYFSAIRRWLLDYDISEEFMRLKEAPLTDDKLAMMNSEDTAIEGMVEVKELIERGSKYYNKDAICSADLFTDMMFEYPELSISDQHKNRLLKKLGYISYGKPIKVDNKTRRIWTKKVLKSPNNFRKLLPKA